MGRIGLMGTIRWKQPELVPLRTYFVFYFCLFFYTVIFLFFKGGTGDGTRGFVHAKHMLPH